MPNVDDCEIVRVFAQIPPSTVSAEAIPNNKQFQIVVEAEAGTNLHGGGGDYNLSVVVTDVSAGVIVANLNQPGNFGDPNWLNPSLSFTFPPIPAQTAAKDDHIYQATSVVRARKKDPIVSFDESPLFVITPP
jgi:hypothetical protein